VTVDRDRLRRHVELLAAVPRPAESAELGRARDHVEQALREAGWPVRREAFTVESFEGVNLLAEIDAAAGESRPLFIVTAHVDSRSGTPGADDNASAVACLLELARLLRPEADDSPVRLRLIATDLEECGMLGAAHHARGLRVDGAALMGMVSLEMLGYRDPTPGSQQMPKALEGLYPDTGDFIGVVGNERSAGLLTRFATAMKCTPELRVEALAVPGDGETFPATRLSDHSAFWDEGFQALMVTDTSFFRNPHYHLPSDTPETLDYEFLTAVTQGVAEAIRDILGG
jgi:Zn-dependent M28 family amino/carboxypeptidase